MNLRAYHTAVDHSSLSLAVLRGGINTGTTSGAMNGNLVFYWLGVVPKGMQHSKCHLQISAIYFPVRRRFLRYYRRRPAMVQCLLVVLLPVFLL